MRDKKSRTGTPVEFDVAIEKLIYGGDGLGRNEGKVVLVPFSAPGDLVTVRSLEDKKKYVRAGVVSVRRPGPGRIEPSCPHFLRCGGCQWQHIEYGCQVEAKRRILKELFYHRFPETRDLPVTMRPSPHPFGYRSRARVQARGSADQSVLGFFQSRSHGIEDIVECPLLVPALNRALAEVRSLRRAGTACRVQEWELAGSASGEWVFAEADPPPETPDPIASGCLHKKVGAFTFAAAPSVFFQANEFMLEDLAAAALQDLRPGESALDLYAGVGFFTLPLAQRYREVWAVESSPQAHRLCMANAERAHLANIRATCADVGRFMHAVGSVSAPAWDLVLLDPPRTGAPAEVIQRILACVPEQIVYVSCDPQTLVRDLALIPAREYRIERITGLDIFPQTFHFETVVSLKRQ